MANGTPTPHDAPSAGSHSGRTVQCVKFQKELPGLDAPPWPGELGQRVYETVSTQAWKLWEERMKMILNEYRLMPSTRRHGQESWASASTRRSPPRRGSSGRNG